MREIGGYMELEHFTGEEYHKGALRFNTATNALLWLLKKRHYKTIYFPDFLCKSVFTDVTEKTNLEIQFYTVDENFQPILEKDFSKQAVLYVVNYYSSFDYDSLKRIKAKAEHIIVDNVQAFFQRPLPGVDTLYSCRKWFGVPDGSYLYTDIPYKEDLVPMSVGSLMDHLVGRWENGANAWYKDFQRGEVQLQQEPLAEMSLLTRNLLCAVDYTAVAARRQENFRVLASSFDDVNLLKRRIVGVPFMYPLRLREEQAQYVRSKLLESKIYIPILWPNLDRNGEQLSRSILPLPVDQRYTQFDMMYLAERLNEVLSWK